MVLLLRVCIAGFIGFLVGGSLGWAISTLLITAFTDVLGPRYAEFDMFGVIGAAFFGAVVSSIAAPALAALLAFRPPAGQQLVVLMIGVALLVAVPTFLLLAITIFNGDWAWLLVIYLAICLGTLTGVGASLLLRTAK